MKDRRLHSLELGLTPLASDFGVDIVFGVNAFPGSVFGLMQVLVLVVLLLHLKLAFVHGVHSVKASLVLQKKGAILFTLINSELITISSLRISPR